jgi:threonine dehydrogenase-like Zn-dependent dehydrogenase
VGPIKIESDLPDEKVLFLSDIFPTGYMAAENADIEPGDTVAVWGCGPVAQMAIQSCWMLGAGRVVAIDRVPERLEMARTHGRAETINFDEQDVYETLTSMTKAAARIAASMRSAVKRTKPAALMPSSTRWL